MDEFVDYYAVLQVHPAAEQTVIEKAYKALISKYHPDVGGDLERAKDLTVAYGVLRDPAKRRAYDEQRRRASSESPATEVFTETKSEVIEVITITEVELDAILAAHWLAGAAATARTAGRVGVGIVAAAVLPIATGVNNALEEIAEDSRQRNIKRINEEERIYKRWFDRARALASDFGLPADSAIPEWLGLRAFGSERGVENKRRDQLGSNLSRSAHYAMHNFPPAPTHDEFVFLCLQTMDDPARAAYCRRLHEDKRAVVGTCSECGEQEVVAPWHDMACVRSCSTCGGEFVAYRVEGEESSLFAAHRKAYKRRLLGANLRVLSIVAVVVIAVAAFLGAVVMAFLYSLSSSV